MNWIQFEKQKCNVLCWASLIHHSKWSDVVEVCLVLEDL